MFALSVQYKTGSVISPLDRQFLPGSIVFSLSPSSGIESHLQSNKREKNWKKKEINLLDFIFYKTVDNMGKTGEY